MTNQQHPITPPDALRTQWRTEAPIYRDSRYRDFGVGRENWLMNRAAQWGADQELEACCMWITREKSVLIAEELGIARRPKPPSLKEQALEKLMNLEQGINPPSFNDYNTIRRALEALPNDH
jgi:hypothetical protein